MKSIIIITIVSLMISCNMLNTSSAIHDFIPGIYVTALDDQFTKGVDTLEIKKVDNGTETYSISKRSYYQQTFEGKKLKPVYKRVEWIAIYDEQTMQLREETHGRIFTFIPKENKLLMGAAIYKKK